MENMPSFHWLVRGKGLTTKGKHERICECNGSVVYYDCDSGYTLYVDGTSDFLKNTNKCWIKHDKQPSKICQA